MFAVLVGSQEKMVAWQQPLPSGQRRWVKGCDMTPRKITPFAFLVKFVEVLLAAIRDASIRKAARRSFSKALIAAMVIHSRAIQFVHILLLSYSQSVAIEFGIHLIFKSAGMEIRLASTTL